MRRAKSRRHPAYDPSTDGALGLWLDPSVSASILNTSGGAITNGATIGTWNTRSPTTSRPFTQWGAVARPTFVTNAINGLSAVRFQSQLLTTTTSISAFNSLGGLTITAVGLRVSSARAAINLTCVDPNTGLADITHWGANAGHQMNGWRRPRTDTFQTFNGDASPDLVVASYVWDFTNAQATLWQEGVKGPVYQTAFGSAGSTTGTAYALSIGGFAQQTGSAGSTLGTDGYAGEVLLWFSARTADQLIAPHDYMRRKWGVG